MPGPISDCFDPEWGTNATAGEIISALQEVYRDVSCVLDHKPPMYIVNLVDPHVKAHKRGKQLDAVTLNEWQWRIIRFALERAKDSI